MTVIELINKSATFLQAKGIDSPRLQSELLLAHVLGVPRLELYLSFDKHVPTDKIDKLRDLVIQRAQKKPLQLLIGSVSFYGIDIAVKNGVFIPRPETEVLVDETCKLLKQAGFSKKERCDIFEFGIGTGCISIAIAANFINVYVTGIDISELAVELATSNAINTKVHERTKFITSTQFNYDNYIDAFDIIVSNPPYIPKDQIQFLQSEVKNYDPIEALNGGDDGLDFYRNFSVNWKRILKKDGYALIEFDDMQENYVKNIFLSQKWKIEKIIPDLSGKPRVCVLKA